MACRRPSGAFRKDLVQQFARPLWPDPNMTSPRAKTSGISELI